MIENACLLIHPSNNSHGPLIVRGQFRPRIFLGGLNA